MATKSLLLASRWTLKAAAALVLLTPACVVKLSDRNAPLENGGVSGPNVECSTSNLAPASPSAGTRIQGAAVTKLTGRFDLKDPAKPRFDWSGNAMTARFQGTEVTWGAESGVEVAYEEVIDGVVMKVILGGAVENHTVTRHLPDGFHEITVMRTSEALYGDSAFLPFTFGPGTTQLPVAEKAHRIEYIGDSITCGYGNEGANATCPYDVTIRQADNGQGGMEDVKVPMSENVYLAYGSIAARKLDAEATTICFSGKGVNVNYREIGFGEGAKADPSVKPDPDAKTVIPDYYLRTLATERPEAGGKLWDFSKEAQPEVVVLNLGTNDFARDLNQDTVPDGIDLPGFQAAYARFVEFVRGKRPNAQIFLAVPPMITDKFPLDNARTNLRNTLHAIVEQRNGAGDAKIYFMEYVEQGTRYGLGCDYHPNLEVHRIMADQTVGAIRSKTCWPTTAE
jgi:lysophospholipase L1-like esterase